MTVQRLAIIGGGLIGSSIARAARAAGAAEHIAIADTDPVARERLEVLGIADQVAESAASAVVGADLVIFCVPVLAMGTAAKSVESALKPGAIISDTGSVKGSVAEALSFLPQHFHVIPGHPIAGTEQSGPDAGFAELFEGRWVILTPAPREDAPYKASVEVLKTFWEAIGSTVEIMDVTHHDLVLAVTSHLPHLIAYNIVGTAADLEDVTRGEVMKYSAGGFRDFTRIAASDPVMWRDIFIANKDAVLEILGRFTEDLQALSRNIRRGEAEELQELFTRTRAIRRGIIEAGQESPDPNFGRNKR